MRREAHGGVSEIGSNASLTANGQRTNENFPDHHAALAGILDHVASSGVKLAELTAVVHRVVHGGPKLSETVRINDAICKAIDNASVLAPLHNPHNLAGIEAVARIRPQLPQYACFDTAFHQTNPEVAIRFALPPTREVDGFRRYGFHGISYQGLVERLRSVCGSSIPSRLLAMHLGNGASLCAIKEGRSVATTMGYSPLDGLTMGTRCGSIDPTVVLELAERTSIARCKSILNSESGLLGLGDSSDMQKLSAAGNRRASFAIEHFCYWAIRHAGSMIAAMGGCDGIAFTGGIGENAVGIREKIVGGLGFVGAILDGKENAAASQRIDASASDVPIWIVPADEERTMAKSALSIMRMRDS